MSLNDRAIHHQISTTDTACGKNPDDYKQFRMSPNKRRVTCANCVRQGKYEKGTGKLKCQLCGKPYRDHATFTDHAK